MKNYIIILMLLVSLIGVVSADNFLGTIKESECIELYQYCDTCSYVNLSSISYPNKTIINLNSAMTKTNVDYNYTYCNTTSLGTYSYTVCGDKDNGFECEDINFEVTSSGNPTPDGIPSFQMGLIIIIFGISCFFLYLSTLMGEVGFKIFFLVTSLIFLMGAMLTAYLVSIDGNVASTINSTTLSLITVLGMIIIIIFAYVMIRQTINALDMYRINKGLKMGNNVGSGRNVGGYDTKRAY